MARTIASAFEAFKANLEITGLQHSTVSARQRSVREAVESEMTVLDSFLTGSYSRHTLIAPLKEADVDIFVVLGSEYWEEGGEASLLDKLRRVLLKVYTKTPKINRNGQAVTITFTDFVVDVVPAFRRKGGGFLIPDSIRKQWISTDPRVHVDVMSRTNADHNGELVPLIKMVKGWNRVINRAFRAFYLELLTRNIFVGVPISDYPSAVRRFFDKGRHFIRYTVKDPVEYGGQVQGLDSVSTADEAVSRFETAYKRANTAVAYAKLGKIESAIDEWRKIFGDYFPAYGLMA